VPRGDDRHPLAGHQRERPCGPRGPPCVAKRLEKLHARARRIAVKLEGESPPEPATRAPHAEARREDLTMAHAHQQHAPRAWPAAAGNRRETDQQRAAHDEVGHDHAEMLRRWSWRDFANILLGVWLIASPATLAYRDPAMVASDLTTGGVIVLLGALTLSPRFDLARWGLCFSGIWLLFAPLVFWTRDAGAYANDTVVGAFVST
jgi:hypothetical protein